MNPPTIREELDRKVVECLEHFVRRGSIGEMSARDLRIAGAVMWQVCAGLVPTETSELVAALARTKDDTPAVKTNKAPVTRTFLDPSDNRFVLSISWTPDQNDLFTLHADKGYRKTTFDTPRHAKGHFYLLCRAAARSYKELGQ